MLFGGFSQHSASHSLLQGSSQLRRPLALVFQRPFRMCHTSLIHACRSEFGKDATTSGCQSRNLVTYTRPDRALQELPAYTGNTQTDVKRNLAHSDSLAFTVFRALAC